MIGDDDLGSPEKRAGDRVRLECVSSGGNPIPQIEWRRNGRPLPEGQSVGKKKYDFNFLSANCQVRTKTLLYPCETTTPFAVLSFSAFFVFVFVFMPGRPTNFEM